MRRFRLMGRVMLLGGLLFGTTGCGGKGGSKPTASAQASALFAEGQRAYAAGRHADTERQMTQYLSMAPRSPDAPRAHYWLGMSRLALGDASGAREELGAALTSADDEMTRAMAMRGIGKCYFLERRYTDAEATWQKVLTLHAGAIDGAELLRLMEESARRRGDNLTARQYREDLTRRYPQSPYLTASVGADAGFAASGAPAAPVAAAGAGGAFTIQAGAFDDKDRATALASKIKSRGIEAVVVTVPSSSKAKYVVRAGTFSTRASAVKRQADLERMGVPSIIKD